MSQMVYELIIQFRRFFFNTLRPRQNACHFADNICKSIFLNENVWIPIKISLKFVPKGPINHIPALVQIMAWRRPGDKPLSEPMMVGLPMHICVASPQWVNFEYKCMHVVGECANMWPSRVTIFHVIAIYIFIRFWLWVHRPYVTWFSGSIQPVKHIGEHNIWTGLKEHTDSLGNTFWLYVVSLPHIHFPLWNTIFFLGLS